MTLFIIAIVFTLGVSAFCSLLEALLLSTTSTDVEELLQTSPRKGTILGRLRTDIEDTSSAILSLNTIANTLGAVICGGLATIHFGNLLLFSIFMTVGILIFSEIIPKNVGVLYRPGLLPWMVYPLWAVCVVMKPFSVIGSTVVRAILRNSPVAATDSDREIILLARKSAKEGSLTVSESNMISNTLSLDNVTVKAMMTPRTVVSAYEKNLTVRDIFSQQPNIPFARFPVFEENIDNVIGQVRRRDLLKAKAEDRDNVTVESLMQPIIFIPENGTADQALRQFLREHQQLGVVVDEFGSTSGVLTMEDIIEHIIGQEIFEKDDVAIDMRELARRRQQAATRQTDGRTITATRQQQ